MDRLSAVERGTPAMAAAMPNLAMPETVMIRLFRNCMISLSETVEPAFRSICFTGISFYVMCLLMASADGQASPSELSDLVGTSRANMTKILNTLVSDGFVSRSIEERDSRRQIIKLTASGIRAAQKGAVVMSGTLRGMFSGLSKKEFSQLDTLLRKAIASFDNDAFSFRANVRSK